jgi:soluble lytic murein transglycosylase-like protein
MCLAMMFLLGGDNQKIAESVAKMQAAIEKQRASIRRQHPAQASGFFTTPWLDMNAMEPAAHVSASCEPVSAAELRKLIVDAATQEGVNPLVIQAMIGRESAGRPCAVSSRGAEGLMQLMPGTSSELGVRDPFNPAENVAAGARYLKQMLDRYKGDLRLALAAYNAGPQRVDESKNVPPIPETRSYVSAILSELGDSQAQDQ